jgi:3-phosphoshikimate 1-carboxyvinyltransferase
MQPEGASAERSQVLHGLAPGGHWSGGIALPRSKSHAQRALLAAALAHGRTRLCGWPAGADCAAALAFVEACGIACTRSPDARAEIELDLVGRPPAAGGWRAQRALELGESATLARLGIAAYALCAAPGSRACFVPRGSLRARRSAPLFACLSASGIALEGTGPSDGFAQCVTALGPPSELVLEHPVSSQELSALLLALAAYPGENRVRVRGLLPSSTYVELTRSVLSDFGASCALESAASEDLWCVRGPLLAPQQPLELEPDASAAAVAWCAACIDGAELELPLATHGSAQGDWRVLEHLAAFGCSSERGARTCRAGGAPTRGAELELGATPDLAPPLAALAAAAAWRCGARSRLSGLGALRRKESDRLAVLAQGLRAAGLEVALGEQGGGSLEIGPARGARDASELVLDPQADHRMAFAFALLGLVRAGVWVRDAGCVAKSWPSFWSDMRRAGARVQTRGDAAGAAR